MTARMPRTSATVIFVASFTVTSCRAGGPAQRPCVAATLAHEAPDGPAKLPRRPVGRTWQPSSRRGVSEDGRSKGEAAELAPLVDAELPEDVGQVGGHGPPGDVELGRHLVVPQTQHDLADDLTLARRQRFQAPQRAIVGRTLPFRDGPRRPTAPAQARLAPRLDTIIPPARATRDGHSSVASRAGMPSRLRIVCGSISSTPQMLSKEKGHRWSRLATQRRASALRS